MTGRKRVLLRIVVGVFGAGLMLSGLWVSLISVIMGSFHRARTRS